MAHRQEQLFWTEMHSNQVWMDGILFYCSRCLTVYPSPDPVISLLHRLGDRENGAGEEDYPRWRIRAKTVQARSGIRFWLICNKVHHAENLLD